MTPTTGFLPFIRPFVPIRSTEAMTAGTFVPMPPALLREFADGCVARGLARGRARQAACLRFAGACLLFGLCVGRFRAAAACLAFGLCAGFFADVLFAEVLFAEVLFAEVLFAEVLFAEVLAAFLPGFLAGAVLPDFLARPVAVAARPLVPPGGGA